MAIMRWLKYENISNINSPAQTSLVNYQGSRPLMSERDKKIGKIVNDKLAVLGGGSSIPLLVCHAREYE